jgi:poly(A) polymerase
MLRLLRFRAKLGFDVDAALWKAFDAEFFRVSILTPERVRDELLKIIATGRLADTLRTLEKRGQLGEIFPEFCAMKGCEQDAVYHSEGDVWTHTLMVIEHAPKSALLQIAALLHDAGKPATREQRGQRVSFILHEKVSTDIARQWLRKWRFPRGLRERVEKLVSLHLRGGDVMNWKSLKPARKLIREAGDDLESLLELIEADSRASLGPDGQARVEHLAPLRSAIEQALQVQMPAQAAVSGRRLMEYFGLSSGPEIKRLKQIADDIREEMLMAGEDPSEDEILQKVAVFRKS